MKISNTSHRLMICLNSYIASWKINFQETWLSNANIIIYVRQGKHLIGGKIVDTLDLATINIDPQSEGIFKQLISGIERDFKGKVLYVESIINERLLDFLLKNGWTKLPGIDNNVYKNN